MAQQHVYKAIFFDLDGTLLPMDTPTFLKSYLEALGKYVAKKGENPARVLQAVSSGSKAMMMNSGVQTNEIAFWKGFCDSIQATREQWQDIITPFYENDFKDLGNNTTPAPEVRQAIDTLKAKG